MRPSRPPTARGERNSPSPGKRAKLSKAMIVEAAWEVLSAAPSEPLTFERIAKHLGVSPMSLYVHVGSRDALLDSVAERAFQDFAPEIDPQAPWEDQLRSCLIATFLAVAVTPAPLTVLLRLTDSGLRAWAPVFARHAQIIAASGLPPHQRHKVLAWVMRSIAPIAVTEAAMRNRTLFAAIVSSLAKLDDATTAVIGAFLPSMLGEVDAIEQAEFFADRIVDGALGYINGPQVRIARPARGTARRRPSTSTTTPA